MDEMTDIHALEMIRRIREQLAEELRGKSDDEVIAFFRKAGQESREEAARRFGSAEQDRKRA